MISRKLTKREVIDNACVDVGVVDGQRRVTVHDASNRVVFVGATAIVVVGNGLHVKLHESDLIDGDHARFAVFREWFGLSSDTCFFDTMTKLFTLFNGY